MNRENKRKANRNIHIFEKYVKLYKKYVSHKNLEYCFNLVEMIKKEFDKDDICLEINTEGDEPYIIATIENNGNFYKIKVSKNISRK